MDTLSYKTISGNAATADKKWFIVDAENQTVGRLASKVAKIIRGKHKTNYTPHADCGDNVIVINAERVSLMPNFLYMCRMTSQSLPDAVLNPFASHKCL